MTDQEFQREVLRGLKTIMGALIRRYGLAWTDILPREENSLVRALAAGLETASTGRLTYDCHEHGQRHVVSSNSGGMRLACGCEYVFAGMEWVRREMRTPLAYGVKT